MYHKNRQKSANFQYSGVLLIKTSSECLHIEEDVIL